MLVLLLNIFGLTVAVFSTHLTVLQPLDGQLPLVARVDKPYSWSFSYHTFGQVNGVLKYTTSSLPRWLSFDSEHLNFHGTPLTEDEGDVSITVTAEDSLSMASSTFSLYVTSFSEPKLSLPISGQFIIPQPSLSSVFTLAPNSALATQSPALRIPPKWSFSVGFEYETCLSDNELFYDVRLRDGSDLPQWMFFNPRAITVNGIVPSVISQPTVVSLCLHCSDKESYSALSFPFDIIISAHELSTSASSLPTINITAATSFSISLFSPADFSGVLVDGKAIQPHEILDLRIDTSQYITWLRYDQKSRTLSGDPGNNTTMLGKTPPMRVTLTSIFNQSIQTLVSFNVVPSYFLSSDLLPIEAAQGGVIQFNLMQDFSNVTSHNEVKLTASFEPTDVVEWLSFDPGTAQLSGTIPLSFAAPRITVTFTAFSNITHSTSHTRLAILFPASERTKNGSSSHSTAHPSVARTRLVLGLSITFGIVGGLCLIAGILAIVRRCARVDDTAIGGEEGRNVWSEQDQRWYNIGLQKAREDYGGREGDPTFTENPKPISDFQTSRRLRDADPYEDLGLNLRRVSERSQSEIGSPKSNPQSPGVMSKREFITRIKHAVRVVSDKAHSRKVSRQRPIISRPLLLSNETAGPLVQGEGANSPSNPFDGPGVQSHPGSTIMTNSPSTSTGEHSIPRRRADFVPPRPFPQVHFESEKEQLSRQLSSGSTGSSVSSRTHAAEAIVRTVSRVINIRHAKGSSKSVLLNVVDQPPAAATARPRLVPFTSATRVPVPRPPASPPGLDDNDQKGPRRIASQTARVWRREPTTPGDTMAKSGSGDELSMGLHYVQSLGVEMDTPGPAPMSSVDLPHHDNAPKDMAMVLRSNEKFRFRVPILSGSSISTRKVEVRSISGNPLPRFLNVDMSGINSAKGVVELHGTPGSADLGKIALGVYDDDGVCIKTVRIEVVKWR